MFCLLEVVRMKCAGKREEARTLTYALTHTVLQSWYKGKTSVLLWAVNFKLLL